MLNTILIQGRLTKDPELRYTMQETPVASFSIACERDTKNADGQRETDFIDCVAWRRTGTFVSEYFHKGDMIVLSGRLQIRHWEDDKGYKRRSAEVVVISAYFGGDKRSAPAKPEFEELDDDGELPF